MSAKRPDPLDVMVGARIRIFRTDRGLSQSDLAEKIGVAFQQVQKYESGANRVGASRLSRIAAAHCSNRPSTTLPIRNRPFTCLWNRMPCGFLRRSREPPIRGCGGLSLSWSKALPINSQS
jgi:transcriptional regulator with XRE-family HTH domain